MSGFRQALQLLAVERRARWFFVALTQSSLGTGAAYVALLLIAYERFRSPWAISAILLADFVPSMVLGPVFGAAADRWSRRWCAVLSDLGRGAAFIAIAVIPSFEATVALAILVGGGNALFKPAALAALPTLVDSRRMSAATSLFGAIADLGFTVGPAIAAVGLLLGGPEEILVVNGVTFLISAVLLAWLDFGDVPEPSEEGAGVETPSLWQQAREGIAATARLPGIRVLVWASAAALLAGGLFNVAELLFATEDLDAGEAGYSLLVTVFGVGFVVGSLSGAGGGTVRRLKRQYLMGLAAMGFGFAASAAAPTLAIALASFALAGLGNGLFVVHERLLIQTTVPEALQGRVFAVGDTLVSWGFAAAFAVAGALVAATGAREVMAIAGGVGLLTAVVATIALRAHWGGDSDVGELALGTTEADAVGHLGRQQGAHAIDRQGVR